MRFAGFTETSRANAFVRSFKDQCVFRHGHQINQIKDERLITFTGPSYGRLSCASMVDIYLRSVSDEGVEFNWKSLLGVTTTTFKLNTQKLNDLVAESEAYVNPEEDYFRLRWHDVVVLLLLRRLSEPFSELNQYATFHLQNLTRLNREISEIYKRLTAPVLS